MKKTPKSPKEKQPQPLRELEEKKMECCCGNGFVCQSACACTA